MVGCFDSHLDSEGECGYEMGGQVSRLLCVTIIYRHDLIFEHIMFTLCRTSCLAIDT